MNVRTFNTTSIEVFEKTINDFCTAGFTPTLAIVFAPVTAQLDKISFFFRSHKIKLYGCTTAGEICKDKLYSGQMVCMLFDLDPSAFKLLTVEHDTVDVFKSSKKLGEMAKKAFAETTLIVASGGLLVDAEKVVYGLKAGFGGDAPIFGGMAGDDLLRTGTFVFSDEGYSNNSILGLVFDASKVILQGLAVSGWSPIGVEHTITKAEGNVVHRIDNERAMDVFIKYFGYFDSAAPDAMDTISAQYPIQVIRPDGTRVLRSPLLGNDTDGTLHLIGGVQEGDRFHFSIAPGFEVMDETVKSFGAFKKEIAEPDALILFSCKGRHAAFGPLLNDEIEGIYNHWSKPMVGFLSYGEIGQSANGVCDFHNETCCLVAISEIKHALK